MTKYEIHLPIDRTFGGAKCEDQITRAREAVRTSFGCFAVPFATAFKYDGERSVEIVKLEFISTELIPQAQLRRFKNGLRESLQVDSIMFTAHRVDPV